MAALGRNPTTTRYRACEGVAMRFNLRLRGKTKDGVKCWADVSVYANSLRQLRKQADHAAKSAAWLTTAQPYDPIPEGATITVEHVEKI